MRSKRFGAIPRTGLTLALALGAAPSALAAQDASWCESERREDDRYCEVREYTLDAPGALEVDASPNGGIEVVAWDRDEVRILAKVVGRGSSEARAREIADEVEVETGRTVRARGPDVRRREGWWVSYRIQVPARYDLWLESTNGGVTVRGVQGSLRLQTTNGGVRLADVGGDVRARTTNGGMRVSLSGSRWEGEGLDATTTNGGVVLDIPDGYSAHLEAGTRNGGFRVDFPITVSGRLRRTLSTDLGAGGAPIRVRTTNGGVEIRRAG